METSHGRHFKRQRTIHNNIRNKDCSHDAKKKVKWDNINESSHGFIGMHITPNLRFHLDALDSLVEAWKQLNIVFGLKTEIQVHRLENQLHTLDPCNFYSIEYLLSKFKTFILLLEGFKVKKDGDGLIYGIISKLGPVYSIFVSTFHSTIEDLISTSATYKYPSFNALCESLIREQNNLLHLGLIKSASTSNKSLIVQHRQGSKNINNQHPKKNGPQPKKKGPKHGKEAQPNNVKVA